MKFNKWTLGLAAVGVVSLASAARADEKMSQVQTALSNTTLSGYVDTSAMWNTGSQRGGPVPPYTPGLTTGDGFNLNAVDVALDKPMGEDLWASGYHAELMFGQDSVGIPLGYSGGATSTTGNGSAIRQAYLALRTPIGNSGIDWKIGVWDTPWGYESSSSPLNPNFTRSYGWFIEPTTFTGILGTYKATDWISFSAGVANAQNGNASNGAAPGTSGTPYETQKAYIGSVTLTAPDSWGWLKGATLQAAACVADNGSAQNNYLAFSSGPYGATWAYVGATIPTPLEQLKAGVSFDYVDIHNSVPGFVPGGVNNANDSVYDIAVYAEYQFNDKLKVDARGEFFSAQNAGGNSGAPTTGAFGTGPGHTSTELTGTVTYKLWENVLSRAEIRWDKAGGKAWNTGADGASPINKNEILLALNLIYQF